MLPSTAEPAALHDGRRAAVQVPGGVNDSISSNTKLGRAVNDACAELEALGKLACPAPEAVSLLLLSACIAEACDAMQEREQLEQANDLLRKLGISEDMLRPQPSQADLGS